MADSLQDLRVADLVTFLAVHRARSVTGAARVLGVTPSQVSKAVVRLEKALNVTLMVRGARGITVSEAGVPFIPRLEEIIGRLQGLRSDEAPAMPELTLAAPSFLQAFFLPTIAAALADHRLRCVSLPTALMRAYASERLFAVALTIGKERLPQAWVTTELGQVRRGLFASPALAAKLGRGPIRETALADVPFISAISVVNSQAIPVEDGCPLGRDRRRLGQEVETMWLGLDLAVHSEQVIFGPVVSADRHLRDGRLVEVVVQDWRSQPKELIYLHCNGDEILMRVQRSLVEHCRAALVRAGL